MAPPTQYNLTQEIQAELQAKKQRLLELEQQEANALARMEELQALENEIQQLNTSARKAQEARHVQNSGMMVEDQVQNQSNILEGIRKELRSVKDAIAFISGGS
ncbi:hypothetical protein ACJ72_04812 [Emergomyces africanus]|uniref:Uncharacterized protein n=1 Tax=Emergomyces africanus TaxID=1955775 RepID=A0A1B7NVP6_9EURO|nr:hypothetical protein ACJ72_04812 [Emergomyces africanus]